MSLFLFYNECFMFFIYFCESRVNNNLTYMVKMKRLFLLCAFVSMFATCNFISAQKELGIFNSVSAGVGVGLTGVDVEVATDRKSTRLNSSHKHRSRMPSSA